MGYIKRLCHCGREYLADERNLKRGWGLSCSKSCAASKREMSKPGYDPKRVESNNTRRLYWNSPSIVGGSGRITGRTSEGYRIMDGVAYDEFDQPVYNVGGFKESEQGWDNHK